MGADEVAGDLVPDLMQMLIDVRDAHRRNQEFDKADTIRDRLATLGVVLEDHVDGTTWHIDS
jgi:cysteinyl-tRNA synthetase